MNKKADITVVVLVIATVALVSFTLFTFFTKSGFGEKEVLQSRFVEKLNAEEGNIRFFVLQEAINDIKLTSSEIGNKTEYTPEENFGVSYNDKFKERFLTRFKGNIIEIGLNEQNFLNLKDLINNDMFDVNVEDSRLQLDLTNLKIETKDNSGINSAFRNVNFTFSLDIS